MRHLPNQVAKIKWQHATAAANTAVVITLPATPDVMHVLVQVNSGYSAAPTGGRLTVAVGGNTIFDHDVVNNNDHLQFASGPDCWGLHGEAEGQEMVITLAAGGVGIIGKLNIGTA